MEPIFQINPQLDIPIYRQLADALQAAVKKGSLKPGQRLPTVRQMSQTLAVARGTVKRAYDELERAGLLEKVQGRGTFVRRPASGGASRKEQAMAAIDALLESLEAMGFTAAEVNIFLNLKLRQRAEREVSVKVAVVENTPETLWQMTEQLRRIPGVDLYAYSLDSIRQYPYQLGEEMELVVTAAENAGLLESLLPVRKRVGKVALGLASACLTALAKLPPEATVGVLGYSLPFAGQLHSACQTYAGHTRLTQPEVFSPALDMEAYLAGKDAVLLPRSYEKYCTVSAAGALERFSGQRILCAFEMDAGSLLSLEEKIRKILETKSI